MSKKKQEKIRKTASYNDENDFYNNKSFHRILLFTAALILYGWTYTFSYNLDDDYIPDILKTIENNFHGVPEIFKRWFANADYRPISVLSFWAERFIFNGLTPGTSHLINVFIYGILLIMIYEFILLTEISEDKRKLSAFALLSTLLFLVHPNHVSVVVNIKSRDNLLSMLFGILACIQLIKSYDLKQYLRIPLFLIFITLALLSKLDSIVFGIIPALVIFFFRDVNRKRILKIIISTGILLLISLSIRKLFISNLDESLHIYKMKPTDNPLLMNGSFTDKLSLATTSLFYYLKFLLIPFGYYFFYGHKEITLLPLFSITNISTVVFFTAVSLYCIFNYKKRMFIFSWLFFLLSILYALNFFIPISGAVSDRYNFIASLGFCMAFAKALEHLAPVTETRKLLTNKVILVILICYCLFTVNRTADWKDEFTLYEHDLPHIPNSLNAYRIAAGTYIYKALNEELKPDYNKALADSFILKGERYALTAMHIYDKSAEVWELLGLCSTYKKEYENALQRFSNCYKYDTTYLSGINYLGFAYWNVNKIDSALYYFNFVIEREPFYSYSARNMINMLIQQKRYKDVDSVITVLKNKFPGDTNLNNKIESMKINNSILFPAAVKP